MQSLCELCQFHSLHSTTTRIFFCQTTRRRKFLYISHSSFFLFTLYDCPIIWSSLTYYCDPVTGPVVTQRVGRGIALLFHDRGTRRGCVVSSTPRPHFTPGKHSVHILQKAGWAPGPVWTGGKSRPTGIRSPDCPARSQSLYRLSYPVHITYYWHYN